MFKINNLFFRFGLVSFLVLLSIGIDIQPSFGQSEWTNKTVETGPIAEDLFSSLELDSNRQPHIAYKNNTVGAASLRYTFFDGQDLNTQIVDGGSETGSHASLEIDSSDDPHISYRKGGIGGNNDKFNLCSF